MQRIAQGNFGAVGVHLMKGKSDIAFLYNKAETIADIGCGVATIVLRGGSVGASRAEGVSCA